MDWWEKLYSSWDYPMIFQPYTTAEQTATQVNFIIDAVQLRKTDHILDLCCGTGRHTLELARRGYRVLGFDWSSEYLTFARQTAATENIEAKFIQGDMRHLDYHNEFNVVLNMFTSFGYFDDDEDNERVIQQVEQALVPGGAFLFDFINLEPLLRFSTPVIWHHDATKGMVVVRERALDLFRWRVNERCRVFENGREKQYAISYRLYTLAEFSSILRRCGLLFVAAYGDFDGRDVCENSPPRMIVVARKPVVDTRRQS